ncbi:hypothetical protein AWC02_19725 [Mycolicibacter engbaekii]|uniref:Uncharacterized protein n=1 Tax=Mycolicibacter engbaekii TaxID=188915 RepID=A0A1X1T520_9MYCO|nr:hypothetical protein [Mycolicibacter engbaekii]ORV39609.1 hypothetical protein AWC02_19725 [Mycolicibacter engbaekii]
MWPFRPEGGPTDPLYQSLDSTVNSTGTGLPDLLEPLGLDASALPLGEPLLRAGGILAGLF